MNPVKPTDWTTLVLNYFHQPHAFINARAAFYHVMKDSVKGVDAAGNYASWDSPVEGAPCWQDSTIEVYPDQPCMRSAEREWPVPTIAILQNKFGHRPVKNETTSTRRLYRIYRGVCQYCLCKIPYSQATRDHVYPRSHGGTNDAFNLVLACRRCNTLKADKIQNPVLNIEGQEVKPRSVFSLNAATIPHGLTIREEWKPYIHTTEIV
jgi:5-methylcytosine-specific restriction endonuclease McrA